jgi:hypothetical protein
MCEPRDRLNDGHACFVVVTVEEMLTLPAAVRASVELDTLNKVSYASN